MSSIARAKVTGVHLAKSPLVVMTEDHSYPEPGWAEALVAAHRRPFAAVGPQLRNANPDSMVSWADFYIAYGEWVDHRVPIFTRHLPGHNSCYKRQILLDYGDQLERLLEAESILHWDLKQKGHELLLETAAKTHHLNFSYWQVWIPVQFHSGRIFAATPRAFLEPGQTPVVLNRFTLNPHHTFKENLSPRAARAKPEVLLEIATDIGYWLDF